MIKQKGIIQIEDGCPNIAELKQSIAKLKNGNYEFYILDDMQNRVLPHLKYLNGVVLKTISENLPDHPDVGALYRYYEQKFAPEHTCDLLGDKFTYKDLKTEPAVEVIDVINRIIHHALTELGIRVPTLEDMKKAEAKELYVGAYAEIWKDYFSVNSSSITQQQLL